MCGQLRTFMKCGVIPSFRHSLYRVSMDISATGILDLIRDFLTRACVSFSQRVQVIRTLCTATATLDQTCIVITHLCAPNSSMYICHVWRLLRLLRDLSLVMMGTTSALGLSHLKIVRVSAVVLL